ncbi:MAG: excisionase family DNA-binding protein [Motilibacteraceae bacterium]
MQERLLYKPEEAAEALGIGRSRLFQLLASGELESVSIGRSRRITRAALEGYVDRLQAAS